MKNSKGVGIGDYVKIINAWPTEDYKNNDILEVVGLDDDGSDYIICLYRGQKIGVASDEYELHETSCFTKDNLRTGYFVEFNNGEVGIVNVEAGGIAMKGNGYVMLETVTNGLGDTNGCIGWKVSKVYRPTDPRTVSFTAYTEGKLLYDRNIKSNIKEYTIEELEAKLGERIKIIGNAA